MGLLDGKNAVIYGGGGFIGSVVSRVFAREGAHVFVVGRNMDKLNPVVDAINTAGGHATAASVDVMDEAAVETHLDSVGRVDAAVNLVSRGDVQGTRLLDMKVDDFVAPTETGLRANFITARACARRMAQQGSGVILMVTSGSGGAATPPEVWPMGGTGPADAAIESFMRYLAAEVGPRGVRSAVLWTAGAKDVESPSGDDPFEAKKDELIATASMLKRRPTVQHFAEMAAFLASDRGAGTTASIINVNSGLTSH